MSVRLEVSALTDVGCVRSNNEDSFSYDPELGIYVVCDGMGGMAAGEVASSIACDILIGTFRSQPPETPATERLENAIVAANDAVRLASTEGNQHGMGTTLVAAVLDGHKLVVGNVGDSRAYLFTAGKWAQLTVDHSYVNELVRQGTVKIEDIGKVDLKGLESVITRAIGAASEVEPDFYSVDLNEGDTLLLASDGLTRYAGDATFSWLIDTADLSASCARLIQTAKAAGGADNITCLLLRYGGAAPSAAS
jgi:protein phosphatase